MKKRKCETRTLTIISLVLVSLIIVFWFFSHFRIGIVNLKDNPSIVEKRYYDCPAVGIQPSNNVGGQDCDDFCYVGCSYKYTKHLIENNPEGKGLIFYWN